MKTRIVEQLRNFLTPSLKDATSANARMALLEGKIAEMTRRLDIATNNAGQLQSLTPQEVAHIDRFRMDQSLLLGWQGKEREQLVERTQAVMSRLRPKKAAGFQKIRVGSAHDGGYVLLNDFERLKAVFSFGVEQNADFDLAMAQRGLPVFQFDHSIEKAPVDHPKIVWEKKMIAPTAGDDSESISHLLALHNIGETRPDALLKMDIEHAEWAVLDATLAADLRKFTQIVAEFHGFDYFSLRERLEMVERVTEKLLLNFCVVHVHANNYAGVANYFGLTVPYVLEFTFANRDLYEFVDSDETYPGPLDAPCYSGLPDIRLGGFHY